MWLSPPGAEHDLLRSGGQMQRHTRLAAPRPSWGASSLLISLPPAHLEHRLFLWVSRCPPCMQLVFEPTGCREGEGGLDVWMPCVGAGLRSHRASRFCVATRTELFLGLSAQGWGAGLRVSRSRTSQTDRP